MASCNKTDEFEDLDLLLNRDWRLHTRMLDGVDITDSCDIDDVMRITSTDEFTHSLGALRCEGAFGNQRPTGWKFIENNTVMRMRYSFRENRSAGTMILYWEIVSLSDTALVLKDATAENNDLVPEFRYYR